MNEQVSTAGADHFGFGVWFIGETNFAVVALTGVAKQRTRHGANRVLGRAQVIRSKLCCAVTLTNVNTRADPRLLAKIRVVSSSSPPRRQPSTPDDPAVFHRRLPFCVAMR